MNAYLLAAALVLNYAKADFAGDASAVASAAQALSSKVGEWQSSDGVSGALPIQASYFPQLESAVKALSGDLGSLNESNLDIDQVNSFGAAVVGALNALSAKASDFESAQISSLVASDLNQINGPAGDIVNKIVEVAASDCGKLGSLTSILGEADQAFNSISKAYSVSAPSIAIPTSCGGAAAAAAGSSLASSAASSAAVESSSAVESSARSSAAESSRASSAAESSHASSEASHSSHASSEAAAKSSGAKSSGASSSAAATSSAAKSSSSASSTSSASSSSEKNGAMAATVGAGAVFGAIALLL